MEKIIVFVFILLTLVSHAQTKGKLKVFLDCNFCDFDYVRTEMRLVDFVRDRFDADVHVLITSQNSSSGGKQATMNFIGQRSFGGMSDTLTYFNDPTSTEDDQRKRLVQYLKMGLVRYISKTSLFNQLNISFSAPQELEDNEVATTDKWHYWVYQFGANGSLNGSQNYKESSLSGNFSADKETEKVKISFNLSANRNVQTFIDSSGESKFTRKDYNASSEIARKINEHWAYGLSAGYKNSLYSNIKAGFKFRPKIEYSFYPYAKFNNTRVVLQYMLGPIYNVYYDTTVYLKTSEFQVQQSTNLIASFTQPWGSINMGVFFSNYFEDLSKNQLAFIGAVSWRITKGLNFAIYGNYNLVHDQITLRKGNFTRDELLVKTRELKSTFEYNVGLGFSYRFGSILNNIVNPTFKGLSYSINF